jgi:hypothetical protein
LVVHLLPSLAPELSHYWSRNHTREFSMMKLAGIDPDVLEHRIWFSGIAIAKYFA